MSRVRGRLEQQQPIWPDQTATSAPRSTVLSDGSMRRTAGRKTVVTRTSHRGYSRLSTVDSGSEEVEGEETEGVDVVEEILGESSSGGVALARKPSVVLPTLQEWERRFFDLVAGGDTDAVKEFLLENPGFNINCVNYQGLSSLHIGVMSSDEQMVRLLLSVKQLEVGDVALHAARADNLRMLELILDHLSSLGPQREYAGCVGSADFRDGTTPLLIAAQNGYYDMIGVLLGRGHTLPRPHPASCFCDEVCKEERSAADRLATAMRRLELYRAWCNPAFLTHSSDDPVLTAFELCRELRGWAKAIPALASVFIDLSRDAREFAVDIMGACRSSREVEVLLKRKKGCDFPGEVIYPRLMLAVDYVQKEFVAHANTQQVLASAWTGDWGAWRGRSDAVRLLIVLSRVVMLPFITVVVVAMPKSNLARHYSLPINKLINFVASYIIFLTLAFVESNRSKKHQKRGPPSTGVEIPLVIYVLGFFWSSTRMCMIQGPRRYFSVLSNWYDAVMHLLFIFTFFFWLAALLDVAANDQKDLERKYWHFLDPTLLAEGFFALATIMAFARLLLLLQFNYHLGPLQVSLGKMFKDFVKYVFIFGIILLSFSAGLCRLYEYYDGMTQHDAESGSSTSQLSSFVSFSSTLKTLFWCVFCMSPPESAAVVIEDLPADGGDRAPVVNEHNFTEAVGYICFTLFMVFSVIIILNMLVATICNTFAKVVDNVDVEWTFGRTEIYMNYLMQTVLPPPYNLIPTAAGIASVAGWCSLMRKPTDGRRARFSIMHCCYIEVEEEDTEMEQDYHAVMALLVQRYFREHEPEGSTGMSGGLGGAGGGEGVAEAVTLEMLKREIQSLRSALLYAIELDPVTQQPRFTRPSESEHD